MKFTDLTFKKANPQKDSCQSRKRPIVAGKREYCAVPLFAHKPSMEKIKKLSDSLYDLN